NLPFQPTPFIGRERELMEVIDLVGSKRRLVSLIGPPGSGKTRLALEAVRRLADSYPDGVWWAPLQSLQDPLLVMPAIAAAIGAKGDPGRFIGEKRMLILIDNFEHVLEAAAEAGTLLSVCPNVSLVATSRAPLHLAAEREYRVSPMLEQDAIALM